VARGLIFTCAIGAVACGSILGLGDYEIGGEPAIAPEAGMAVEASGGITLSTASLAFPEARCGERKTLPIVVTSTSASALPLTVTAPNGVTVEGAAPNVPANGSITLTIGTTGVDQGKITIKAGTQSFDVAITGKFQGPELAIATSTLDFGEIRHDRPSDPQTLALENPSDEDVTVTGITAASDFTLDEPVTVPAHGNATASFTMAAGPGGDPITESASLTTDKPLCDSLPPIVFKGRRSPSDVTVSRSSVNVPCNANGQAPPVVVRNYGAQYVTIAVKTQPPLGVSPMSTGIGPGTGDTPTSASFTVGFSTQTLGDYTYDLVITEGDLAPRTVTIQVHLYGAKLQYDTSAQLTLDAGTTLSIPATDVGNAAVCMHYDLGGTDGTGSVTVEPDEQFDPNVPGDIEVTARPSSGGDARHDRVHVRPRAVPCPGATAATPLCAGLPEIDVDVYR
jgi:hypothetical protein